MFTLAAVFAALTACAPPAADVRAARDLEDRAIARNADGDFAAALSLFERAFALSPDPEQLANMGRMHEKLGRPDMARQYYERFLATVTAGATAEKVNGWLDELPPTTQPPPTTGSIRIVGVERDDVARLDGNTISPEEPVEVAPGAHDVSVRRGSRAPFFTTVDVVAGREAMVVVSIVEQEEGVNPWPWVLVGTGTALLATGLTFTLIANQQYNDYAADPTGSFHLLGSSQDNDVVAYSMYGVGGAAFVGGLTWGLIDLLADDKPQ